MPPADQYAQLKAAVLGATANSAAPLGDHPEIASLYAAGNQLNASGLANAAPNFNTGVQVDNAEAQKKLALQAMQDAQDPSKYEARRKDDGGYDFYDPQGTQIDIATYAKATNQKPADIVKDSDNPIDIQYASDHQNLTDFITAVKTGDTKTVDAMKEAQQGLKKYNGEGGIDKLIKDFQNYYKRYYITRDQEKNAWGAKPSKSTTLLPNASTAVQNSTGGSDGGSI